MRKLLLFATVVAIIALCAGGCSMIVVDKAMDDAEAVAIVNGEIITKAQGRGVYVNYMNQLYEFYVAYGLDPSGIRDMALDALIEERVIIQKARELGLDAFDEGEEADIAAEAEGLFAEYVDQYVAEYGKGDTDDERREYTAGVLGDNGLSAEALADEIKRDKMRSRVGEYAVKDVEIGEEELAEAYGQAVKDDSESYAEDHYAFESAMRQGGVVSWIPEGYRIVKHVLLPYGEAERERINRLDGEIDGMTERALDLRGEADALMGLGGEGGEPDPEAEGDIDGEGFLARMEEIDREIIELEAGIAAAEGEIARIRRGYLLGASSVLEGIYAMRDAGEGFDAIIEAFGEDPQMELEPVKARGLYACAQSALYEEGYAEAAMAIGEVGGWSAPTITPAGIYIIKYVSDAAPGEVGLEAVRGELAEKLLEAKKSDAYKEELASWLEGSDVKRFPERMALE